MHQLARTGASSEVTSEHAPLPYSPIVLSKAAYAHSDTPWIDMNMCETQDDPPAQMACGTHQQPRPGGFWEPYRRQYAPATDACWWQLARCAPQPPAIPMLAGQGEDTTGPG